MRIKCDLHQNGVIYKKCLEEKVLHENLLDPFYDKAGMKPEKYCNYE